jgi:hypothetical protein
MVFVYTPARDTIPSRKEGRDGRYGDIKLFFCVEVRIFNITQIYCIGIYEVIFMQTKSCGLDVN